MKFLSPRLPLVRRSAGSNAADLSAFPARMHARMLVYASGINSEAGNVSASDIVRVAMLEKGKGRKGRERGENPRVHREWT